MFVALVTAAVLIAGPASQAHRPPSIQLKAMAPLTVSGRGFASREHVRVVAAAGDQQEVHRLRATRHGTFSTRFADMSYDRCSSLSVKATGAKGSQAALKRPPVMCAPQRTP